MNDRIRNMWMNEWTNGRISFYFSYLNLIYSIRLIQLGPNNIEQRRKNTKIEKILHPFVFLFSETENSKEMMMTILF